ncbi:MAG: hypothetical protein ACFFER_10525 [Candidatus Thorarchaeota archaeon]
MKLMFWSFDTAKYVQSIKKRIPSKATSIFILVALGAFLVPLPHYSHDSPDDIRSGVVYPYPGETELELNYEISSNSTVWWYDKVVEISISLVAVVDISKIGRIYNLTYVLIALNIEDVGRFYLIEEYLSGDDGIFANTSINGNEEVFEYQRSYQIPLTDLSALLNLGLKLHANLDVLLIVDWYGHGDRTTRLSNFQSGGITDWIPKPFPITLDSAQYRMSGILTFWSVLLIPIPIFLIVALWKKNQGLHVLYKQVSFWLIIGTSGIYISIVAAVTFGVFVPDAFFQPYSALVTFLIGIPISFLLTGIHRVGKGPMPFIDQYLNYEEFCTLTGVRCRSRNELSDSALSWSPYKVPSMLFDLAASRILAMILVLESIVILGASIAQPTTLFLQQLGAIFLGCTLYVEDKGDRAARTIRLAYYDWDIEWYYVWTLVYDQVVTEESAFARLNLLEKLRNDYDDYTTDTELICRVLDVSEESMPDPRIQPRPESIKIALLAWYVGHHLRNQIEELSAEPRQVLSTILQPFEEGGMPWRHPLGSTKLLRRVIFVHDAISIDTQEAIVDISDLILDNDISETTVDNIVRARVSSFYNEARNNPTSPSLNTSSSVREFLPFWSIFYLIVGLLLAGVLIAYI